ncbi:MAG: DUF5063 domain-containing protein [Bacteroidota bacterium]|jgi:hypothetical protein|nr:DUF5063 domain-containing protein [Bacteroidota bacterium]HHU96889.1 DUF5063 domain-containing protein [Petrimonas sp.]
MDRKDNHAIIYDKQVIEFMAVAVEFCSLLEKDVAPKREEWVDKMVKLLPLLYLKAWLLPETVPTFNEELPAFVKEEDYHRVAHTVENVMGDENVYLDVFVEEMRYSDTPVTSFVSEAIADIYQDVRNLVSVYQFELTAQMNDALYVCKVHFFTYWGQKLVNVLRPLHALKSREWTLANEALFNEKEPWD